MAHSLLYEEVYLASSGQKAHFKALRLLGYDVESLSAYRTCGANHCNAFACRSSHFVNIKVYLVN